MSMVHSANCFWECIIIQFIAHISFLWVITILALTWCSGSWDKECVAVSIENCPSTSLILTYSLCQKKPTINSQFWGDRPKEGGKILTMSTVSPPCPWGVMKPQFWMSGGFLLTKTVVIPVYVHILPCYCYESSSGEVKSPDEEKIHYNISTCTIFLINQNCSKFLLPKG